jgi:hypothetical protein
MYSINISRLELNEMFKREVGPRLITSINKLVELNETGSTKSCTVIPIEENNTAQIANNETGNCFTVYRPRF